MLKSLSVDAHWVQNFDEYNFKSRLGRCTYLEKLAINVVNAVMTAFGGWESAVMVVAKVVAIAAKSVAARPEILFKSAARVHSHFVHL